jgi:RND family efflux transporter MFP subunit
MPRSFTPSPRALASLSLLPILATLAAGCGPKTTEPTETAASPPTPVEVLLLEPTSARDEIIVPVELEPRRRARIAAEAAGRVLRIGGDLGDRVGAGAALLVVDQRAAQEELSAATALERQARLQRERAEALLERKSITKAQLLDAVTNHEVASARLAAARVALANTTVAAPWKGAIAARLVEVGDYVVPGQATLELVDASTLTARAVIAADDARWIADDAEVVVLLSSRGDQRVPARLVRRAPAIDPVSRTLEVEAELDGGAAIPGEPARLAIVRRQLEAVLLVPAAALIELERGHAAYVVEAGNARRREVTVGARIGEQLVIEAGLAPGDRVIVRGQDRVADGQAVEVAQP